MPENTGELVPISPFEKRDKPMTFTQAAKETIRLVRDKLRQKGETYLPENDKVMDWVSYQPNYEGKDNNAVFYFYGPENKIKHVIKIFDRRDNDARRGYKSEISTIQFLNQKHIFPFEEDGARYKIPKIVLEYPEGLLFLSTYLKGEWQYYQPESKIRKIILPLVLKFDSIKYKDNIGARLENSKYFSETPQKLYDYYRANVREILDWLKPVNQSEHSKHSSYPKEAKRLLKQVEKKAEEIMEAVYARDTYTRTTTQDELRLNHGDIALSNIVALKGKEGTSIGLVDFEDAGWDNRFGFVSFLYHPRLQKDMSYRQRTALLESIGDRMNLTSSDIEEVNVRSAISYLVWITKRLKSIDLEKNRGFKSIVHIGTTYDMYVEDAYFSGIRQLLEEGPIQYKLGSHESLIFKPLPEMPLQLEEKIREFVIPKLERGRKGWDREHTVAVVDYVRRISEQEGEDVLVLTTSAWFHDIGYAELFGEEGSQDLKNIRLKKDDHMENGKAIVSEFLSRPEIAKYYTKEQIERIIHLVSVHDKVEELKDKDEIILMEADTLGVIDISRVKPTFDEKDIYQYTFRLNRNRFPRFETDEGKRLKDKLYPKFLEYFNFE